MNTYLKTMWRMFRRHITRLVSVVLMVLVSIGFAAGIGMATDKLDHALDDVYRERNVSDLVVKSTRDAGFTEDEISKLRERYAENVFFGGSLEFENRAMSSSVVEDSPFGEVTVQTEMSFEGMGDGVTKVYFFDGAPSSLSQNTLRTIEEEVKTGDSIPVYAERSTYQFPEYALGTPFKANVTTTYSTPMGEQTEEKTYEFYLAGVLENPLHLAVRDDVSLQFEEGDDPAKLGNIFYLFDSGLSPFGTGNDAYIAFSERSRFVMLPDYKNYAEAEADEVKALLGEHAEVLTLSENFTFSSFHEYGLKIEGIGYVMMVVFLLVTLLVVLSTMTRLLDEERAQIGCLTTLGYSPMRILSKYLLFAFVGTLIGGGGGYLAAMGLSYIVYINFVWNFEMPPYPPDISLWFFLIVASAILIATLAATLIAGLRMTGKAPAELLRPKSPRPGKKVILERIPLLWNRVSFKYKSTLRNVLRFKTRFFMTVVAVMASTALVLAGLAVLDCCLFQEVGTAAMIAVAVVVLVFAALLNAVVIYTLTNINISERERELATLMVLGYYDNEVTGYVFREIYITGSIGIAAGLPFGCLLCYFIFKVMGFGSIPGIGWYVWIAAPLLSLLFTFLVTLLLRGKILRIHMNESLKAIE